MAFKAPKSKVGRAIMIFLVESDLTQKQFAEMISRPNKTINEIIKGKKRVSAQTAIDFELATGKPAIDWLILDAQDRLEDERKFYNPTTLKTPSQKKRVGGIAGSGKINELKLVILAGFDDGMSISDISRLHRLSYSGVYKALERWGVDVKAKQSGGMN